MPNIPRFIPWIRRQVRPELPTCSICNEPVELETTRSNENGKAIHEECYVLIVNLKQATTPPERLTAGSGAVEFSQASNRIRRVGDCGHE